MTVHGQFLVAVVTLAEYRPPWPSAWFIAGATVAALGCLCAARVMLLHVVHITPFASIARRKVSKWLRPVLRDMSGDLRQAADAIVRAMNDGNFSNVRHDFNLGENWENSRHRLVMLKDQGDLYDALRDAYACIASMRRIARRPGLQSAASHNLPRALETIHKAETAVIRELAKLGLAAQDSQRTRQLLST
jgi:hypothetical protein